MATQLSPADHKLAAGFAVAARKTALEITRTGPVLMLGADARLAQNDEDGAVHQPERTEEEGFRRYPAALHADAFMAAFRGHQYAAQLHRDDPAAVVFRIDGLLYPRSVAYALTSSDKALYDWVFTARVGESLDGIECLFDTENMVAKYLHSKPCSPALAMQIDANPQHWIGGA